MGSATKPDFEELVAVIRGQKEPERVHLVELGVDGEVVKAIVETVWGREWVPNTEGTRMEHMRQHVGFYAAMGYDFAPGWAA